VVSIDRLIGSYQEELTTASFSALLELAVALGHYRDAIVLVGGWAPYLLIGEFGRGDYSHVGSIDIDLAVNPELIDEDDYSSIVDIVKSRGYVSRNAKDDTPLLYSFTKTISSPVDRRPYSISIDFLTSHTEARQGHRHRTIQNELQALMADGCELAFNHNVSIEVEGTLASGAKVARKLNVLDIPGCVCMKGIVLGERYRQKDAYDIYSVIGHCLSGPREVAGRIEPFLQEDGVQRGVQSIDSAFRDIKAEGPTWVAEFLSPVDLEERSRIQAETYSVVKDFLDNLVELVD